MRRRIFALLILILLLTLTCVPGATAVTPGDYDASSPEMLEPTLLYAQSAILIDEDSGTVLFEKNPDIAMHPASTTKIMTLLLGLERGIPLDREIAIPQAAADVPGDSTLIPVYPGETMTYGDLLTAFTLSSGNDGANAVAVIVAGTIDNFVAMMNERAAQIGCINTHFANAHGYTDENHFTCASDLARITRVAMANPTFRDLVRKTSATVHISGREDKTVYSQHLIMKESSEFYYKDCIGVKTGTTSAAGKCYVGAAERDGATLISVVLRCDTDEGRWIDTARLFDYGWTRYETVTFDRLYRAASGQIASCMVSNAKSDDVGGGRLELDIAQISDGSYKQIIVRGNTADFQTLVDDFIRHATVRITHDLSAPITRGEIIGDLTYSSAENGRYITAKLVASRDVEEKPSVLSLIDVFPFLKMLENKTFAILLCVLALLVLLIVILAVSRSAQKQRRRREMLERRRAQTRRQSAQYAMHSDTRKKSDVRRPR